MSNIVCPSSDKTRVGLWIGQLFFAFCLRKCRNPVARLQRSELWEVDHFGRWLPDWVAFHPGHAGIVS